MDPAWLGVDGVDDGVCWADKLTPSPVRPSSATIERSRFMFSYLQNVLVCESQSGWDLTPSTFCKLMANYCAAANSMSYQLSGRLHANVRPVNDFLLTRSTRSFVLMGFTARSTVNFGDEAAVAGSLWQYLLERKMVLVTGRQYMIYPSASPQTVLYCAFIAFYLRGCFSPSARFIWSFHYERQRNRRLRNVSS